MHVDVSGGKRVASCPAPKTFCCRSSFHKADDVAKHVCPKEVLKLTPRVPSSRSKCCHIENLFLPLKKESSMNVLGLRYPGFTAHDHICTWARAT